MERLPFHPVRQSLFLRHFNFCFSLDCTPCILSYLPMPCAYSCSILKISSRSEAGIPGMGKKDCFSNPDRAAVFLVDVDLPASSRLHPLRMCRGRRRRRRRKAREGCLPRSSNCGLGKDGLLL